MEQTLTVSVSKQAWAERAAWFAAFLACGLWTFLALSYYRPLAPKDSDLVVRAVTALVFLGIASAARRSTRFAAYWRLPLAFAIATAAQALDYHLDPNAWLLPALGISSPDSPAGWAVDKLQSSLLIILPIILLTLLSGDRLGAIYIQRGRLKLGLAIGLGTFIAAALLAIPWANWLFAGRNLSLGRVLPWAPWVVIFVLANAAAEELLFRGLFLRKLAPLLGAFGANLAIAIPFVLMHASASYFTQPLIFLAFLFLLALGWGATMQRTDSWWGSVLFHAGMDIAIVLGIFSNLP
jgi:hypothetical protein